MKSEELIKIVHDTRKGENQLNEIAEKLLNLFCINNCPDLSDVWNLAVDIRQDEQINIFEMNNVWGALRQLEAKGKCELADPW